MSDPNRDAAIRYTDSEAVADQIADRAYDIAMSKIAQIFDDKDAIADLVIDNEFDIWGEIKTIIQNAACAMSIYVDRYGPITDEASFASETRSMVDLLRACERLRKVMTEAAYGAVIDDATDEADEEVLNDGE